MNITSHGSTKDLDIPMPYETCMVLIDGMIDFDFDFFSFPKVRKGGGVFSHAVKSIMGIRT